MCNCLRTLSGHLPVHLPVHLPAHLPIHLPIHLSILYLSICHLPVHLPIHHLSIYLSHLLTHLPIHLPVHVPIHSGYFYSTSSSPVLLRGNVPSKLCGVRARSEPQWWQRFMSHTSHEMSSHKKTWSAHTFSFKQCFLHIFYNVVLNVDACW